MDGAYFGGYVKPANRKEDRKDRRRSEHQSGKRQSVIVMRERGGNTLTFVTKTEGASVPLIRQKIDARSTVYADEAAHWDVLHAKFAVKRINHSVEYSNDEANTNMAESFFSRLRRAEIGTHHHIAGRYLAAYAGEMNWREDNRRLSNGEQYLTMANAVLAHPVSDVWCGYWQRRKAA